MMLYSAILYLPEWVKIMEVFKMVNRRVVLWYIISLLLIVIALLCVLYSNNSMLSLLSFVVLFTYMTINVLVGIYYSIKPVWLRLHFNEELSTSSFLVSISLLNIIYIMTFTLIDTHKDLSDFKCKKLGAQ